MGIAVDEYLARLPKEQRQALGQLRQAITSVVPGVEEVIRSGVPAFRYKGKPLVSIGAAKRHVSLFIMYGGHVKDGDSVHARQAASRTFGYLAG